MKKILFLLLCFNWFCDAQNFENEVLLEIADEEIMADEFIHIYEKNLSVLSEGETNESLDEYLQLFVHFHLKLAEAKSQGIHEEDKFQKEFKQYYKQLADNYIANGEVTDEMIKETYQRLLKEVRVSHLLIQLNPKASEEEWNEAYEKALQLKKRLDQEEDEFEELAKKFSEDPSVQQNKGDMGWFKAFKMVFPFEDAAFELEVGEISNPVKTQFGYHIIKKTGERESVGKLKVAHIMLRNNSSEESEQTKTQIFKIHEKLKSGDDFKDLAKHFSDDKNTADNGGELAPFEVGEINSKTFEEKAFALKNVGDFTTPFKTQFGWHIVKKLGNVPVEDLETIREDLRRKIKTSNRAKLLNERIKENISGYYDVEIDDSAIDFFANLVDERIYKANWEMDQKPKELSRTLLKIEQEVFTYKDFSNYIEKQQRGFTGKRPFKELVTELFNQFVYVNLVEYHKPKLTQLDRDFELSINEYKHGLLIFEIMEREIWEVAKADSLGLESYYHSNLDDYVAPQKINATAYTFETKKSAKKFLKLVNKKNKTAEEALAAIDGGMQKSLQEIPVRDLSIPEKIKLDEGFNPYYAQSNKYVILYVEKIISERRLDFDEVRGRVISDYQNELEAEWLDQLKSKHPYQINSETFKLLKQKFE